MTNLITNAIKKLKHNQLISTLMLIGLTLQLSSCGENRPHPQIKVLQSAQRAGNLDAQAAALKILVQQDKAQNISNYQMTLEEINLVKQLNHRAQKQLITDKFAALEIAINADKKLANSASKTIIANILRPYAVYYDLKPYLQQWSYPSINKVIVKGLIPNPLAPWQQPLTIPAVWPQKQLITLLQTPNTDILPKLPKLIEEHQQWLEIDRLGARLYHQSQSSNAPEVTEFYQDIVNINQMYNTIVSDMRYYYLTQVVNMVEQQLAEQMAVQQTKIATNESSPQQQTLTIETTEDRQLDWQNLTFCCQNYVQQLDKGFTYLPDADNYTQRTSALNTRWAKWVKQWSINLQKTKKNIRAAMPDKPEVKLSPSQWLEKLQQLKVELGEIKQSLSALKKPHQQVPRRAIAQAYLQTSFRWHQGEFGSIEIYLPHISTYKSAVDSF